MLNYFLLSVLHLLQILPAAVTGQVGNQHLKTTKQCLHRCDWHLWSRQMEEQWVNWDPSGFSVKQRVDSWQLLISDFGSCLGLLLGVVSLRWIRSLAKWGGSPCCPTGARLEQSAVGIRIALQFGSNSQDLPGILGWTRCSLRHGRQSAGISWALFPEWDEAHSPTISQTKWTSTRGCNALKDRN